MVLGEESEGKEGHLSRDLPWGVSSSSHWWDIPVLGSYTEKPSPPGWLRGWLGWRGGLGKPGVASGWGRSGHCWLLLKEHSREVQNPDGSQPTPSTHAKSPRGPSCSTAGRGCRGLESGVGGSDQLWGTREIWTWDCVPWERVTIAGTWQAVRRRQPEPLSAADTSKGPPCFITTPRPHSGGSVPVLGQGKHALKGNGVSSVPTLRASGPATWDRLCPSRAGMAPEQRGDPTSHWLQF